MIKMTIFWNNIHMHMVPLIASSVGIPLSFGTVLVCYLGIWQVHYGQFRIEWPFPVQRMQNWVILLFRSVSS